MSRCDGVPTVIGAMEVGLRTFEVRGGFASGYVGFIMWRLFELVGHHWRWLES